MKSPALFSLRWFRLVWIIIRERFSNHLDSQYENSAWANSDSFKGRR